MLTPVTSETLTKDRNLLLNTRQEYLPKSTVKHMLGLLEDEIEEMIAMRKLNTIKVLGVDLIAAEAVGRIALSELESIDRERILN